MSLAEVPIVKKLTDLQDVQIFATIYIGSNQQPFEMIFDTGSNWLWVDSDECLNCPYGMPRFKDEQSTTYELDELGQNTYLYYGTGQVKGDISMD